MDPLPSKSVQLSYITALANTHLPGTGEPTLAQQDAFYAALSEKMGTVHPDKEYPPIKVRKS